MSEFEKLRQAFAEGRITRRELVRRATALGLLAALPAGLLAEEAKAASMKRGGHFRLGSSQGSTTDSLDSTKLTSGFTNLTFSTIHGQLTEVAPDGSLAPNIAVAWEANSDATQWTFELRKGVEFHNGKTLTSEDVVRSTDRHRGEDSESAVKTFAEQIESMKTDGDSVVVFNLKEGNADFPFVLSASMFGILPVINDEVDVSGIGAGAYMLENFDAGVRANYKRHPNHFGDDRGFFDTAEAIVIQDSTARETALVTGEVDYINDVPAKTADLMAKSPGVSVMDIASTQHYLYAMRTDLAPFDNPHVRMALKLSMDREDVLAKIMKGHGTLGNDHPISPSNRYYNKDLPQRTYDPEKAKWHLKQANMEGLEITLEATNGLFPGALDAAILFKEHAAKAGIKLTPKNVPSDGYWSDVWLKSPFAASYWSGRPTEDWMFSQGYAATSNWNETYWKNERFNSLLSAARAELDEAKRRSMYEEMQSLVRDDGGSLIFLYANHISGLSDKLQPPKLVAGNWEMDGYKIIERWAFA